MPYSWKFKSRFRANAYGWKGSSIAARRLKEAVAEIKKVARTDGVTAADGAVALCERLWPALERIDTSSGALGGAVYWTLEELAPVIAAAPADRKTRGKWLERLYAAIQEDGVDYLSPIQMRWGELCASPETASEWADRSIGLLRTAWSDPRSGYVRDTGICLSSLLASGRHRDLFDLLAIARYPDWYSRRFGVQALVKEGRIGEAIAFAEASRGLNQPGSAIDAACERILLDADRADEAYEKYGMTSSQSSTGLATFRAIAKKYPKRDPRQILTDLASSSGEPGKWFAAAKDAGFLDLALQFASSGRTDPRTLSRASRDFVATDPRFSLATGRLAVHLILNGYGYDITVYDALDAYGHLIQAAEQLGVRDKARADVVAMATAAKQQGSIFADSLIRRATT